MEIQMGRCRLWSDLPWHLFKLFFKI